MKEVVMATNYQAGKDFIARFNLFFKDTATAEIYTPLNQPDFSAELAQVASKNPDAVYVFYPGGLGVNFVRQYKQAGVAGKESIVFTSTDHRTTLAAHEDDQPRVVSRTVFGLDFYQYV